MANEGLTTATITGPHETRKVLHEILGATAIDQERMFSLCAVSSAYTLPAALMAQTYMQAESDQLFLSVTLPYDCNCGRFMADLAKAYPTLHFRIWFDCDGGRPDFTLAAYKNGIEIYNAEFSVSTNVYSVLSSGWSEARLLVPLYLRSDNLAAAEADGLAPSIQRLTMCPTVAGAWRLCDDRETGGCYLLERGDGGGRLVLMLDVYEDGTSSLFKDVNDYGGYGSEELLGLDEVRRRFPEMSSEIKRFQAAAAAVIPERDYMPF